MSPLGCNRLDSSTVPNRGKQGGRELQMPAQQQKPLRMSRSRNVLTGWKYAGFIGAIVGAIGLATYPIIVSPYLYPEKWQKMSKEIRKEAGIKQEEIQPGNMKVEI